MLNQTALKKRESLSLVTVQELTSENVATNYGVTTSRSRSADLTLVPRQHYPRLMTTEEFVQVEIATLREGRMHPRWPREVLEKFLAAEVIRPEQ